LTKELRNMRRTSLLRVFVAIAMIGTFAGCTSSNRTSETTGEYVDDAAITTKIKAAILAEPGLKTLQIGVETYKDVVQLSGFVDSPQAKTRAGEVAAAVPGVKSVRNDLTVK
jgi:osmotically-inducible protein OsmY